MTDLWMVRIDRPMRQKESEALLALLPQERRNRLHGHTLEKQPEVLCAYGLLLALLRKRCGWQFWLTASISTRSIIRISIAC